VAVLAAGALGAVGLAITTMRRLSIWAHSWTASASMGIPAALSIAADDEPHLISPLLDTVVGSTVLLLLGVAIGIAGWYAVHLGGPARITVAMPISLLLTSAASAPPFRRLDIAMLASVLGIVFGLLIVLFARARRLAKWTLGLLPGSSSPVARSHVSHPETRTTRREASRIEVSQRARRGEGRRMPDDGRKVAAALLLQGCRAC